MASEMEQRRPWLRWIGKREPFSPFSLSQINPIHKRFMSTPEIFLIRYCSCISSRGKNAWYSVMYKIHHIIPSVTNTHVTTKHSVVLLSEFKRTAIWPSKPHKMNESCWKQSQLWMHHAIYPTSIYYLSKTSVHYGPLRSIIYGP